MDEDLTRGHEIAGTGTINEKGEIGPIGGIQQKVVAASDAGAEVFFAPNEKGAEKSNYKDALEAAKDIKTKMKVVPVDTLDDALMYLEKMGINKKSSEKERFFYRNFCSCFIITNWVMCSISF